MPISLILLGIFRVGRRGLGFNLRFLAAGTIVCLGFVITVRTVATPALATITPSEEVVGGEDYQAFFIIIEIDVFSKLWIRQFFSHLTTNPTGQ